MQAPIFTFFAAFSTFATLAAATNPGVCVHDVAEGYDKWFCQVYGSPYGCTSGSCKDHKDAACDGADGVHHCP